MAPVFFASKITAGVTNNETTNATANAHVYIGI